jgi:hypothetical protein
VSEEELPVFVELVSRYALLAGFVFAGLKLIATILQILFAKGDYRRLPDTVVFRTVYIVGKVTPALAAASFCALAMMRHDREHSWVYGILAVFAALLAVFVVRLRRQGRFFGGLDMLLNRRRNRA